MWLSLTQNATLQQLVHVLLAVAFCPPYEPYQLTGRTTVRVTVSPETVEFRGPHKSVSAQSGLGQERYDAMSAMAA